MFKSERPWFVMRLLLGICLALTVSPVIAHTLPSKNVVPFVGAVADETTISIPRNFAEPRPSDLFAFLCISAERDREPLIAEFVRGAHGLGRDPA